jgi:hydrogenase/urease accessory protein HupE
LRPTSLRNENAPSRRENFFNMRISAASVAAQLIVALVFGCAASLARAHPAPFSYLDVKLDDGVHGTLVVHDFDAAHELGLEKPAMLLDPAVAREHRDQLIALLEHRLRLRSESGPLTPTWGDIDILAERQSLRLPFTLDRSVRSTLDIDAVLFPYDPNHQTFINIYEHGELRQQAILDSQRQDVRFYAGTLQGRWAVVVTFVRAGVHHILVGPDHILFLLGLMLLGGTMWRLATIVTAFTLGHSVTLSLAALGILYLSPAIVEPAIALSIVVVGIDNLLVRRQRQSGSNGRDLRPWLAGAFGLIHGFGFAAVLIELGLPHEALGWSLAAFNVGVEIGQLFIVIALIALARLVAALPAYRQVHSERFLTVASLAVIVAGVYWLAQRLGITAVV